MRLIAEDLRSSRGGRPVFAGVSFLVDAGRALVVTGPNGAGKSTLLRLIAGLIAPDGGAVRLEGGDPEATIGGECHYVGHADALKAALTAAENLRFWSAFLGAGPGVGEALDRAGLGHLADVPAGLLSAGQKRRLALARLLLAPRPIWLLDEPTASLDADAEAGLAGLMAGHLAAGGLIVAATHAPLDLAGAARLMLAHQGR